MNTETFTLSRPLKTHNGEVLSVTLQEPTAGAFVEYGNPFTVKPGTNAAGEPSGITIAYDNNKALMGFLADMIKDQGVDDLILKRITASDFQRLRVVATDIILMGVGDKNPTEPSAA